MRREALLRGLAALPLVGPLVASSSKVGATIYSAEGEILERYLYSANGAGVLHGELWEHLLGAPIGTYVRFSQPVLQTGLTFMRRGLYGITQR